MKFQNCILINFVRDGRTHGQAESNIPLQLFQLFYDLCFRLKFNRKEKEESTRYLTDKAPPIICSR